MSAVVIIAHGVLSGRAHPDRIADAGSVGTHWKPPAGLLTTFQSYLKCFQHKPFRTSSDAVSRHLPDRFRSHTPLPLLKLLFSPVLVLQWGSIRFTSDQVPSGAVAFAECMAPAICATVSHHSCIRAKFPHITARRPRRPEHVRALRIDIDQAHLHADTGSRDTFAE
jgi:hypothetical protein